MGVDLKYRHTGSGLNVSFQHKRVKTARHFIIAIGSTCPRGTKESLFMLMNVQTKVPENKLTHLGTN